MSSSATGLSGQTDASLIDMEQAPEPATETAADALAVGLGAGSGAPDQGQAAAPASAAGPPAAGGPGGEEPVRVCPMCAEKIKAAARKCRFCGALLDEELRAEEARRVEQQVLTSLLAGAARAAHTWRVLAMVVTSITAGWLVLLTMMAWRQAPPALIVFNLLLALGLLWNTRQMRAGPASVFLAGACAVMLCMPLDTLLGLALVDATLLKQFQSQDPQHYGNLTADDLNGAFGVLFTAAGVIFSVPVWIATVKVAALQRFRAAAGMGRQH